MHNPPKIWRGVLAAPLALCFGLALTPQTVQAQQNVILVLDSSGSMAGRVGGVPKIDIARRAVSDILGAMDPKTKLGLYAYGHRRKGDCSDIQMIHGMAAPNRATMMEAVNALRPIGKTPLSDAVRMAAEKLKYTEAKATVILVSDGEETCDADPCALGQHLKARGIDFKVHVVGFSIRRGEEAGLQCLARNTGGIYVAANNASALKKALAETVKKVEAEPAPPVRKVEAPPPPRPAIAPGLKVRAFITTGGREWPGQFTVDFFGKPEGLDAKRKKIANIWKVPSGHVIKDLKPGEYLMQLALSNHGHITKSLNVNYQGGAATVDVILDIAEVRLDAVYDEEGSPIKDWNLTWDVLAPQANFAGKRAKLANFWKVRTGHVNWLPAGKWMLKGAVSNMAHVAKTTMLDLKAGEQKAYTINFNAGLVRFDTKLAQDGPLFDGVINWDVIGGKPDLSGKRNVVAKFWRIAPKSIIMLPAGEWDVNGAFGRHTHVAFKTRIQVKPGSQQAHEVIANAAKVRFDATVQGNPPGDSINVDIFEPLKDPAGKPRKIAGFWRIPSGTVTYLPAGAFDMRVKLGHSNKIGGSMPVQVAPAQEQALKIDLKPL